ncbi:MAG TPA: MarC family protein [Candidatus Eisenbacteria bacterium]|nr:MarC family protein [Candidatus Eisenbacteria bacterium]
MLDASQILILLFVTLGPLKILGPFVQQTRELEGSALRRLELRVFILSVVSVLVAAFLGSAMLVKWSISLPALLIAIAIIFFLVAIQVVLAQYGERQDVPPLPQDPWAAALRLTFPTVITPYGIAAVIALLAATDDPMRVRMILALALLVMALNYVFMMFARKIMRGVFLLVLQVLGSVLGVLQVALSVQILLWALAELGVLPV